MQSIVIPGQEKEGWGEIHRAAELGADKPLIETLYPDVTTLHENFERGVRVAPNNPCLGVRKVLADGERGEYFWQSYTTVQKRVRHVGAGLLNIGMARGDFLGIYSINNAEWVIGELATYTQGIIPVSLYDTLGPEAVAYILQQTEIKVILASRDKVARLIESAKTCPALKTIIQIEREADPAHLALAAAAGVRLISFSEVEDNGAFQSHEIAPAKPDDLATVMYTSGTTGNPKGVMLTHKNIVSMLAGAYQAGLAINSTDVHISYLPLAHIFERAVMAGIMCEGGAVGFYQGSVLKLFDDIAVLKPTIFASVPRLWNRLFDKVNTTIRDEGGIKQWLFEAGVNSKKEGLAQGDGPTSTLWDNIIFKKMKARLGGRVRLMVTGAAPISEEVFRFLQVAFCCPVMQGYGLTETSAAICVTRPHDFTSGHVGAPLPCIEVRLCDVPEMNYTSKHDNSGEVCVRGNNVFKGYYKLPEQTAADIDQDGWFHTGDVGRWNSDGTLSIVDRKKNIFKLAQGEYVAAEHVEAQYIKSIYVQQCFIYGDSLKAELVAIVVPDWDVLSKHFPGAPAEVAKDPKVKDFVLQDMNKTAKEHKLKGFEMARAIHIEHEPFSPENELLTPTFKHKRPQLKNHYNNVILTLYEEIAARPKVEEK